MTNLQLSIILKREKLKVYPLRLETRQGCPLLPFLFNTVPDVLASAIRQDKEINGIQSGKKVKLLLFADDMIFFIDNHKESVKKLLELMTSVKCRDTKPTYRSKLHSFTQMMKHLKKAKRKLSHSQQHQKQNT